MEEVHRARYGGGAKGTSTPCPDAPPSQHLDMFTNLEALQTLYFGDFYGGLIT